MVSEGAQKAMMNTAMKAGPVIAAALAAKLANKISEKAPVAGGVSEPPAQVVQTAAAGGFLRGSLAVLHKGERVLNGSTVNSMKGALKRKPYKTTKVSGKKKANKVPSSGRITKTDLYKVRPGQYVVPAKR